VAEDCATVLAGKRVVVTRAVEQSRELVRTLQDKGAVPILLPMVAFGAPDDPSPLDSAIRQPGQFDWVFLTSQNAVRALHERCHALGVDLQSALGGVRVAAVGPATAESAQEAGLTVSYVARKHLGLALALELAEEVKGKRILLPRSDRANPDLVRKLEQLGAVVAEIVAYKTVLPDTGVLAATEAALQQGVDAILFFSPSAVHHLQEILGNERVLEISRQVIFSAIGPVTEKALRAARIDRVLLAEDTTVASIVSTLEKHFSAARPGLPAGARPA